MKDLNLIPGTTVCVPRQGSKHARPGPCVCVQVCALGKSLWILNLLCVALQGRGAAPSALPGHKHFINHSHSQAALTLVQLRERLQQPKSTRAFFE